MRNPVALLPQLTAKPARSIPRPDNWDCTQVEVSRMLAIRFPELLWRVPPVRKIWMPEDNQMSVFDAVALGLTHLDAVGAPRAP